VRSLGIRLVILVLGALILSPVVAAFGFDPVPGDLAFNLGQTHIIIPVAYSLGASFDLTLLYYMVRG
jgi:hypothetical protein